MSFLDRFRRRKHRAPDWRRSTGHPEVRFSGGSGTSRADAVVIYAVNTAVGISAEYAYVARQCGREGEDWQFESQSLLEVGERRYDLLRIRMAGGEIREFYFDITAFFGR